MVLAEEASELLLLWLPLVDPKRPFPEWASDAVLVENPNPPNPLALPEVPLDASLFTLVPRLKPVGLALGGGPNPEKAATLGNVTLDTALSTVPNLRPVELAFEGEPNNEAVVTLGVPEFTPVETAFGGLPKPEKSVMLGAVPKSRPVVIVFETDSGATVVLAPNKPPFDVTFEISLLDAEAFEPNRLRDEDLGASLLGDTPSEAGNIPNFDEDSVVPDILLLGGGWVDALLTEGVEFDPDRLPDRDTVLF